MPLKAVFNVNPLTLNVTLKAVQVLLYTVYEFYFKLTHFAFVECFETNEYPLNKCYTSNITRCLFSLSTGFEKCYSSILYSLPSIEDRKISFD